MRSDNPFKGWDIQQLANFAVERGLDAVWEELNRRKRLHAQKAYRFVLRCHGELMATITRRDARRRFDDSWAQAIERARQERFGPQ